jgi:hypothetical protein
MNGDGRADVVTRCDPTVLAIFLSTPTGFAAPIDRAALLGTSDLTRCLALGDVNGDGHLDVIEGETGGGLGIYLGTGTGSVGPPQVLANVQQTFDLALADMDGDLDVDIVTGGSTAQPVRLLRNRGDGTFDDAGPLGQVGRGEAVGVGDIDGDGLPDVVPARGPFEMFRVYFGANGYSDAGTAEIGGNVGTNRLTVADLDGDHHLDVFVAGTGTWWGAANGPPGQWYRSHSLGAPNDPPLTASRIVDVDGDRRGDLVNLTTRAVAIIERSLGQRQFAPPVTIGGPIQVPAEVGDINGDGAPDLVHLTIASTSPNLPATANVRVRLNDGAGNFATEVITTLPPTGMTGVERVVTGDLNADGRADVIAMGYSPGVTGAGQQFSFVLLANADGSLSTAAQSAVLVPISILDLDGDGFGDVIERGLVTRRGLGNGTFAPSQSPGSFNDEAAFGHLDGDGYMDALVMGNSGNETWIARGLPGAAFAAPQFVRANPTQMWGAIGDFDGDGKNDAALAGRNSYGNDAWINVLLGDGAGAFPREFLLGAQSPAIVRSPTIGDLDGDTRPDIAIAGPSGYPFHAIHFNTLVDYPTPTLLALVSHEVSSSRVRMVWNGAWSGAGEPWLERREDDTSWLRAGSVRRLGRESFEALDEGVRPGAAYQYRLALATGPITTEASITVPPTSRLAIVGAFPQPSAGPLNVRFSLADGAPASLELFDMAGRSVERREVGGLGTGTHTLVLGTRRTLASGIYLVRLSRDGQQAQRRVAVVR